jgi:hypothetical protein
VGWEAVAGGMASLVVKRPRTREPPLLQASDVHDAVKSALQKSGKWNLEEFLAPFRNTHWKTSPLSSVPGFTACEGLLRELLLISPAGVRILVFVSTAQSRVKTYAL